MRPEPADRTGAARPAGPGGWTSPARRPARTAPNRPARRLTSHPRAAGIIGVLVVTFGLAQLVPYRVSNSPVQREPNWDLPATRALVAAACFDCHSNQTRSHVYTRLAPTSWWTTSHVNSGRAALNFSDWAHHPGEGDIAQPVADGSMPPSYYTWFGLNSGARLSPADRAALIAGLRAISSGRAP